MKEFNDKLFKEYLNTLLINKAIYKKIDITEELLRAVCIYDKSLSSTLSHIPTPRISEKYRIIFDLSSKPRSVPINTWLLNSFGYKYCTKCEKVHPLVNFGKNKNTSSKLHAYCRYCANNISYDWNTRNKEKRNEVIHNHNKRNPKNPEIRKKYARKYRLNNLDKDAAKAAKRRAFKLNATPNWLSKKHFKDIELFYTQAKQLEKNTGIKYHVDHIVPLRGKTVCGLHVPWNLRVITAQENLKKSNKWQN